MKIDVTPLSNNPNDCEYIEVDDMKNDANDLCVMAEKVEELEVRIARLERIAGEQRRHSIAYTPQDMTYK